MMKHFQYTSPVEAIQLTNVVHSPTPSGMRNSTAGLSNDLPYNKSVDHNSVTTTTTAIQWP